ncbi:metallophosphoesterase family protein [Paenibacillus sp. RC67]|uniref:metallophosphoesterase family protein n=1 Tax=Paenibacillus sp. RC67 TaxID=3039392 RepID=UPI0024ADA185|nr:metallophosphoesterase family protein [Paenibacillus sp. RC67]
MKQSLSFRQDGTFTIVQFTDVHMKSGGEADDRTLSLMQMILETERPDLVVFTGDVIEDKHCDEPLQRFHNAVSVVENTQTPWALVFGNHDTEAKLTREQLMGAATQYEFALAEAGPEDIGGVGNYVLSVGDVNGNVAASLYFFDSGSVSPHSHVKGYGWVGRDQVAWYETMSRERTQSNNGIPLPSLAFLHIPLPEYNEVWQQEVCYGSKNERVCCPRINTGLFSAMVEMGDVMGTFAGHDHLNDYWGAKHGIRLCYGRATGYNTYGREGFAHGARIIRLHQGKSEFETWIRLEDGSSLTNQPEHQPEYVHLY